MIAHGGTWWGHNSGKYDALLMMEILRRRGISLSVALANGRVSRCIGGGLTLRDSYSLLPFGLEHAARLANMLCPSLWFDCDCGQACGGYCQLSPRMPYYMHLRVREMCVDDCRVVIAALQTLREYAADVGITLTGTIGGSAWATMRDALDLPDADPYLPAWRRLRRGYYGGRCSVLRPRNQGDGGVHYDVSSAYPAALASAWLPLGSPVEVGQPEATRAIEREVPGVYQCTVDIAEQMVPPLPTDTRRGIAFPVGRVTGRWTTPELLYALDNGVSLEEVHSAEIFTEGAEQIFADWVPSIYRLRYDARKDSPIGKWLRLFCNSGPGKFAESPDKRLVRVNPPIGDIVACPTTSPCTLSTCSGVCGAWEQMDTWGTIWSVPFVRQSDNAHIAWGAWTTAHARISLHRELAAHETECAYTDTDSAWLIGDATPEVVGDGLGQWTRQHRWAELDVAAPKNYAFLDGDTGEYVVRAAGVQAHARDWIRGRAEQDRGVMSLTEAAAAGGSLFARAHRKWTIPPHGEWYGDRRITSSGRWTEPVTLRELEERDDRNRVSSSE